MKGSTNNFPKTSPLRDLENYIQNFDTTTTSGTPKSRFDRKGNNHIPRTTQRLHDPSPSFSNPINVTRKHPYVQFNMLGHEPSNGNYDRASNATGSLEMDLINFVSSIEKSRQLRMHKRRMLIQNMFSDIDWDNDFDEHQVDIVVKKTDMTDDEFQALLFGSSTGNNHVDDGQTTVQKKVEEHFSIDESYRDDTKNEYTNAVASARNHLHRISVELMDVTGKSSISMKTQDTSQKDKVKRNVPSRHEEFLIRTNKVSFSGAHADNVQSLSSIHPNPASDSESVEIDGNIDLFSLAKASLDPAFDAVTTPAPKTPKHIPIFT